jgi:CubicO group peptidase (beta-lactamase class C family)
MIKYMLLTFASLTILSSECIGKEKIREIASAAGIPLIQVAFKEGKNLSLYEIATIDGIRAREDCGTVFQAASLSKPIFAYIVMRMVARGEMDLDVPLISYADANRFENFKFASMLTARIVLNHRSGLPNWSASPSSAEWPSTRISFLHRPDSVFAYSGEAFSYLQRAVENIKGKGLEEIARDEVFKPLGMNSTSYTWLSSYDSLAASGYNREGVNRGVGSFPRANSAYTLRTTAGDYMKFLIALSEGRTIGKKTREEMFKPLVNAVRYRDRLRICDETIFWGLGVGIEKNPELGNVAFHWGDNGNFRALFLIVPKSRKQKQRILVYFTNSAAGHDIINSISTNFLGNTKPIAVHDWVLK